VHHPSARRSFRAGLPAFKIGADCVCLRRQTIFGSQPRIRYEPNDEWASLGVTSEVKTNIFALEEKFGVTINYNANWSANEPFDTVAQVAATVNKLRSDNRS
jgi:hypothetical protein